MNILCIIPARCGSKGVPWKNLYPVIDKPLIYYTLQQASFLKNCGLISDIYISTDCEKIASTVEGMGYEIPFLRPAKFAQDNSKSIDLILHALDTFKKLNRYYDAVLLLQPTSPVRTKDLLIESINKFNASEFDSLISVYEEIYINKLVMYNVVEGSLIPLDESHSKGVRRQDHKSLFIRNGAIYITKTRYIENHKVLISDTSGFVVMQKSDSINIDSYDDFKLIERNPGLLKDWL